MSNRYNVRIIIAAHPRVILLRLSYKMKRDLCNLYVYRKFMLSEVLFIVQNNWC